MGAHSSVPVYVDQGGSTQALLVTGRRGPFPSYRMNGIYCLQEKAICAVTSEPALTYRRIDRPDVAIELLPGGSWRCELEGRELARGSAHLGPQGHLFGPAGSAQVKEPEGMYLTDDGVVLAAFPAPATSSTAAKTPAPRPSRRRNRQWVQRSLCDLRPPDGCEEYTLWGGSGKSDALLDLLQGASSNCGVLAAIDALAHCAPSWLQGTLREIPFTCGVPCLGEPITAVQARLFDPEKGACHFWNLGHLTPPPSNAPSPLAKLEVAVGTSVPRYARSLSSRCWGPLLERALADLAGGYPRLEQCEPGVAWLALLGPGCLPKRYGKWLKDNVAPAEGQWLSAVPAVRRESSHVSCGPWRLEGPAMQRARSWQRARFWKGDGETLRDEALEALLEAETAKSVPCCVYPVGGIQADKDAGEPCVDMEASFEAIPGATTTIRFLVGHAYALRATERPFADNALWVRLRDPRWTRLFWVRWQSLLEAAREVCYVYSCSGAPF